MGISRFAFVLAVATFLVTGLDSDRAAGADLRFKRGDANVDTQLDITDSIFTLTHLFLGGTPLSCEDAADSNDDGIVDISDPLNTLFVLFLGSSSIPEPFAACGLDPTPDNLSCDAFEICPQDPPVNSDLQDIGHLLNRIAYGPSRSDVERVLEIGIDAYIEEQLQPGTIDESDNTALLGRLDALREDRQPSIDHVILPPSSLWRYFKGTSQPPLSWIQPGFDDAAWELGATSIGYGDDDDTTVLDDMEDNYVSVYLRKSFEVADPAEIDRLILSIDYDDGFVAYLNGTEVARRGLSGSPPAYTATSSSHESAGFEDIDITARKGLLQAGTNLLAVQAHNTNISSSDLTINPRLLNRELLPGGPIREYPDIDAVKASAHIRGIYSRRQLQVVLGDFWENHFTTDFDKVAEYLDGLQNSDANDAMSTEQAEREAANLEAREYEFFLENALGNFGDLLRYSANSPTMLIYLDNVFNKIPDPNENYTREIYELHAMGVDNGYVQRDIEEGSRAFTGWNICKVAPEDVGDPHASCGVQFEDTVEIELGGGWKYLKGLAEPTPDVTDAPTTAWAEVGFDDSTWLNGATGIGYGDGDDLTVLSDMRNNYLSVYLRREFEVADPQAFNNLLLEMRYDDGFVAYLNGVEVARSESMEGEGTPPAFDTPADDNHEVDEGAELFNLNRFRGILQPGTNVLAIQMHNVNLTSSDLSCLPRLIDREILPGSIENGDPNGAWSVHFFPELHDYGSKLIFSGRPYALPIPARPEGDPVAGYADANDLIDVLVNSAPTAEFICTKLIRKFVSDEVPPSLLAEAIATWNSTTPRGNIEEVMRTILTSEEFWSEEAYRSKVKDPLEFINSSVRAVDGVTNGEVLVDYLDDMGMELFTRDDPDGWPEEGVDWISTGGFLNRIKFVQDLTSGSTTQLGWNTSGYLNSEDVDTAAEIVEHFNASLYQDTLSGGNEAMVVEFLETDDLYRPLTLSPSRGDYLGRVDTGVALLLSLPQWNFQ